MNVSSETAEFLDSMAGWGSEFDQTFSNHAPMALTALAKIGGSPETLRRFFAYYRDCKHLKPFGEPGQALDATNWRSALGERTREPDLRVFFRGEVVRLGVEGACRAYLPALAPGIAASAFHGLMRLAYALLRESPDDVAIALGYWAATFLALRPATGAAPVTDDPAEVLARAMQIAPLHDLKLHPLLWKNMRDAAATPEFLPVVDWLAIDESTLGKIASTGLVVFAATQHFAALHIVTAAHWLRIVEPHADRATFYLMLRHFWQGIAGLVGELGFPRLPDAAAVEKWRRLPAPDWQELRAAAATSFDEHDISLAFSAYEEAQVYGDPLYRVALARRLGFIAEYRA
jgi:hypothetical protein